MKLQPGDVLVSANYGGDPFSEIRKWFIGPYHHVFMYMGKVLPFSGSENSVRVAPMLFESSGRGVVLQSLSNRYGQEVVVVRLVPELRYRIREILEEALRLASDPKAYYDYLCIIRYVLPRAILEKLHLPIPLSWQRDSSQICSEAIFEVFARADVPVLPDDIVPMPGDFVTSSNLLEEVYVGTLSEDWL